MYDGLTWGEWVDALYTNTHFIFQNEIWALFCLMLFISICIRLHRIENKINKLLPKDWDKKKVIKPNPRRGKFNFRPKW